MQTLPTENQPNSAADIAEISPLFHEDNRATYCPEDNKLRLYVGRVPRDEYEVLRDEGWTSTPKQDCDFVAVWTPSRRDRCLAYAGIIEDEDQTPEERAADRAERFAGYRDKRENEAYSHADRYDAGPSAFGFQDKARAVRAADRHDRHAGRAVDAWSRAEYWQRRTAGVIAHALHASTPAVRMGRIKELEAELRKRLKEAEERREMFARWQECAAMTDPQKQQERAELLAGFVHRYDYRHPRPEQVTNRSVKENGTSLWTLLTMSGGEYGEPITAAEACALFLRGRTEPPALVDQWSAHLQLRLAYEHQMLEAQGGRAAFVEMEPGGFVGGNLVTKVTKSTATGRVVSVEVEMMATRDRAHNLYPEGPRLVRRLVNIERAGADVYTPPTPEQRTAYAQRVADEKKAKAAAAKEKAAKGENCPLINPTIEDAERLQNLINERYLANWIRQNGQPHEHYKPKPPATVCRTTQARYSEASKGYGATETRGVCAEGVIEPRSSNLWTSRGAAEAKARGPALAKVRVTDYDPPRVVVLIDKPQKPFPARVWQARELTEGEAKPDLVAITD